jgi:hypothetical protein
MFSCAIAIHCDREAHDVAVKLEQGFVDRGVDLKFGRACLRLYSELYTVTEDEEHLSRRESYRAHVELLESVEEPSVAA